MASFNRINFQREVSAQIRNKAFPVMAARTRGFFEREKDRMLSEFESHPVTKELQSPSDSSQFLSQGNLVGLFGYEDATGEVDKVRENLEQTSIVFLDRGRVDKDGRYVIRVKAETPSVALLNEETELPWQSKGLVDAVELGVSGFFRTLFGGGFEGSRSGEGIQVKNKVRDESFSGIGRGGYLRGILRRFAQRVRSGPITRGPS
jgi:hypothetical protein